MAFAACLSLSGCLGSSQQVATPPPQPAGAAPSGASPEPAKPGAAPQTSPSPAAVPPTAAGTPSGGAQTVWVGNTDGVGVYIRRTPSMADRVQAYPDSTALAIIGEDVFGDGQRWHHVRAPDGLEGYVPVIYTVNTPP